MNGYYLWDSYKDPRAKRLVSLLMSSHHITDVTDYNFEYEFYVGDTKYSIRKSSHSPLGYTIYREYTKKNAQLQIPTSFVEEFETRFRFISEVHFIDKLLKADSNPCKSLESKWSYKKLESLLEDTTEVFSISFTQMGYNSEQSECMLYLLYDNTQFVGTIDTGIYEFMNRCTIRDLRGEVPIIAQLSQPGLVDYLDTLEIPIDGRVKEK